MNRPSGALGPLGQGRRKFVTSIVDTVPPGHEGRSAYTPFRHQAAALRYFDRDRRWASHLAVVWHEGRVVGSLTVHRQLFPSGGDLMSRAALELLGREGSEEASKILYCVSGERLMGGASVREASDRSLVDEVLIEVYAAAAAFARAHGLLPVALFTPAEQVPAVLAGFGSNVPPVMADVAHRLDLVRATSFESFLAGLTKQQRSTWRTGQNDIDRAGLELSVEGLDSLAELLPLMTAVRANHEAREPTALTRLRTQRWLDAGSGRRMVFAVRHEGRLLAGTVGQVLDDVLQVREAGMLKSHPQRRLLYSAAAYHLPTTWAIGQGLGAVDLGRGQSFPKHVRGCTAVPLWHATGRAR